uniref:STAS domain-containing protein n=1 Tax=Photinus pyralis TaxID=7054 RepID=A0A1Y1LEY7_PHOPY
MSDKAFTITSMVLFSGEMKDDKDQLTFVLKGGMEDERFVTQAALHVQRPVYQTEELNEVTTYQYRTPDLRRTVQKKFASCKAKSCIFNTVPILKWLPRYNWRKNIAGDLASGLTIAIMHIPQGMAYALLGNLPPITGLYMAFFPVLVYVLFGTSRHVSMGTFAVVCLMTGKVVSEYSNDGTSANATDFNEDFYYTPMQVATTVTFTVAAFQMLMYIFRLGIVTTLLSETLVNAFTCASAFHVATSQLKDLFGLVLPKRKGIFALVFTIYDVARSLPDAKVAAIVISCVFITVMVINNEILKPLLAKKTKIPFPIELAAVVIGTGLSYGFHMKENYGLNVVGNVPTGLPLPDLPSISLVPTIAMEAFIITMVSYTITMSMALIVAQKARYEVDANQELLALSFSNFFGSFFSCMPITASLSRTMIQQTVGGVTQLASVVSCVIILAVLLWIGPVFESLPRCVLASIIVVALKSMLIQFVSLKKYWALSKWDATVWIVTFFTTTIISIDYGLLAGILISLFSIFIQAQKPYSCLLGVVPNTDLYLDVKHYKGIQEMSGIKIFHYSGSLNFASNGAFKSMLFKRTGFDPMKLLTAKKKDLELTQDSLTKSEGEELLTRCIILDFAALTYIDPSGVETLRSLIEQYRQIDVAMYICSCSESVFETLKKCDSYDGKSCRFVIFPTIHDAVLFSQSCSKQKDGCNT